MWQQPAAADDLLPDGRTEVRVNLGATAAPLRFIRAEADWGGAEPEAIAYDPPLPAVAIRFIVPDPLPAGPSPRKVRITLYPVRGTAAPISVFATVGQ